MELTDVFRLSSINCYVLKDQFYAAIDNFDFALF